MFSEVIVVDIVSDLSYYTQEVLRTLVPTIMSEDRAHFCDEPGDQTMETADENSYYLRAPRNTILGIPAEEAKDVSLDAQNTPAGELLDAIMGGEKEVAQLKVYYPFFSSHLCLPAKPGESVWTFESNGRKYWMTRVSQPLPAEDPNFTHRERRFSPVRQPPIKLQNGDEVRTFKAADDGVLEIEIVPSFPLGAKFGVRDSNRLDDLDALNEELEDEELSATKYNEESLTFPILDQTSEVKTRSFYDFIYENSKDKDYAPQEPVPRISKRPGDLVLQGSNNSSIVLGTDRGYTAEVRPDTDGFLTNARDENSPTPTQSGVIDLVAGRGRIDQEYSSDNVKDKDPKGTTRPRVIENTRKNFETNKNIGLDKNIMAAIPPDEDSGHLKDVSEGDPDFLHDASRIYISMKSNPDHMLYDMESETPVYTDTPAVNDDTNAAATVSPVEEAASIIMKSDEIRIVSRYRAEDELTTGSPEINGSIRIVKEGVQDSEDGDGKAVIMMLSDGTIMIDGPKIVLGSGIEKGNSEGNQLSIGLDADEPLVLGNKLGELLCKFIGAIVTAAPKISIGASPNVLDPNVLAAANEVLTALGGTPAGEHTPTNNTTLSKLGKTK